MLTEENRGNVLYLSYRAGDLLVMGKRYTRITHAGGDDAPSEPAVNYCREPLEEERRQKLWVIRQMEEQQRRHILAAQSQQLRDLQNAEIC